MISILSQFCPTQEYSGEVEFNVCPHIIRNPLWTNLLQLSWFQEFFYLSFSGDIRLKIFSQSDESWFKSTIFLPFDKIIFFGYKGERSLSSIFGNCTSLCALSLVKKSPIFAFVLYFHFGRSFIPLLTSYPGHLLLARSWLAPFALIFYCSLTANYD